MNIAELRREYMRGGLSEAAALLDPFAQFERWLKDAIDAGLPLPNAPPSPPSLSATRRMRGWCC
jgi:pyridoxamine 5'-phosphate oxidase